MELQDLFFPNETLVSTLHVPHLCVIDANVSVDVSSVFGVGGPHGLVEGEGLAVFGELAEVKENHDGGGEGRVLGPVPELQVPALRRMDQQLLPERTLASRQTTFTCKDQSHASST